MLHCKNSRPEIFFCLFSHFFHTLNHNNVWKKKEKGSRRRRNQTRWKLDSTLSEQFKAEWATSPTCWDETLTSRPFFIQLMNRTFTFLFTAVSGRSRAMRLPLTHIFCLFLRLMPFFSFLVSEGGRKGLGERDPAATCFISLHIFVINSIPHKYDHEARATLNTKCALWLGCYISLGGPAERRLHVGDARLLRFFDLLGLTRRRARGDVAQTWLFCLMLPVYFQLLTLTSHLTT